MFGSLVNNSEMFAKITLCGWYKYLFAYLAVRSNLPPIVLLFSNWRQFRKPSRAKIKVPKKNKRANVSIMTSILSNSSSCNNHKKTKIKFGPLNTW